MQKEKARQVGPLKVDLNYFLASNYNDKRVTKALSMTTIKSGIPINPGPVPNSSNFGPLDIVTLLDLLKLLLF
jgi:hypothetical protein